MMQTLTASSSSSSSMVLLGILLLSFLPGSQAQWRQPRRPRSKDRTFPTVHPKYTIDNMTCHFIEQPLNHFVPNSPTYQQRYCVYSDFAVDNDGPVFFYAGNESPLEQYINQTGLMWELGADLEATIVFAEHRYEGKSVPLNETEVCMSYSSSKQALADYAVLLNGLFGGNRPVIVFGGSYGGMLAGWMRMKYPNMVAGAIAASAPIWGFPSNDLKDTNIDAAYSVVSQGLDYGYPPTKGLQDNSCFPNLLAVWPLMVHLSQSESGRSKLQESMRLCQPLQEHDVGQLLGWAQSIWFFLAEGSFPYPSSYITFSLHMGVYKLPAWPLQAACWTSGLSNDIGVGFQGDLKHIKYNITYGNDLKLQLDWDKVTAVQSHTSDDNEDAVVDQLLSSVRDAISVWFNVSKKEPCFNIIENQFEDDAQPSWTTNDVSTQVHQEEQRGLQDEALSCRDKMKQEGSWEPLCCNEDMNLIITYGHGLGHDVFWPPSHPRGTRTYDDVVSDDMYDFCADPDGTYGYPTKHDAYSKWLDIYYGSRQLELHSNIIFSNGLLDPWSAAGVGSYRQEPGVYNITDSGSILAVVIELGGHHTDLMYSNENDPPCVRNARAVERQHIEKWIQEWNNKNA